MPWSFSQCVAFQVSAIQARPPLSSRSFGWLMGMLPTCDATREVQVQCCVADSSDGGAPESMLNEEINDIQSHFPAGVVPVGVYTTERSTDSSNVRARANFLQQLTDSHPVLILQLQEDGIVNMHSCSNDAISFVQTTNIATLPRLGNQFELVAFKVTASLEMRMSTTPGTLHLLKAEMARIEGLINGKSSIFAVQGSRIFIQDDGLVGAPGALTCQNLMKRLYSGEGREKSSKQDIRINDFIEVSWMTSLSCTSKPTCPVISLREESNSWLTMKIPVHSIALASAETKLASLMDLFRQALCRALNGVVVQAAYSLKANNPAVPAVYQFKPPLFPFPIMISYPATRISGEVVTDNSLEEMRRKLHEKFLLSIDRPLIRPANAITCQGKDRGPYLLDVHEGLPFPGGVTENSSLVYGHYSYHHYLHDKINDDGWGCAYRSLQTIWSWFRYQGYTSLPIPNHRQIQETLVSIGDKPAKFAGSRQWIGSSEVGMCLNTLLGVTYKIMFVSSGSELEDKGRELAIHFQTEGTPIMIGGGVLAHTIIGVDFNERTGQVKFLILDPHYVGPDNLRTIQKDGWCSWKGPTFWDKKAHYNLCLPQRPREI
ncbi:ufm1-specific protease 2-like isoform X2 [Corticium candelabrum]|uniref:ufm1-specific protease 2-like isoform X2 n=1 Tax=Corticium candelabrum TaxID=121492 RepID=UPI002E2713FF|nr:ufm1-specific protease 2-like isoform X2 [Corticium candelabrum]